MNFADNAEVVVERAIKIESLSNFYQNIYRALWQISEYFSIHDII